MWSNIKELLSVISWLDLIALVIIGWAIWAHGWSWVRDKGASIWSRVRTSELFIEDLGHRVSSLEKILVQAKIAVPAPLPSNSPITLPAQYMQPSEPSIVPITTTQPKV